jgi:CheY-like chemotaxis protein
VEHDPKFAGILLEMAHERGFKALITGRGEMALTLARQFQPSAITLDLQLPDMDGWVVLDRLKHDPAVRHIPVHVISVDESASRGVRQGAFACLRKPVSKKVLQETFAGMQCLAEHGKKNLLVVEDNAVERENIVRLIGNGDVSATAVASGAEALEALRTQPFDCLVLDLRLPDLTGLEVIEKIKAELGLHDLPIVVYTGKDLTPEEEARLRALTETIIPKDSRSLDRLRRETAAFLHRLDPDPSCEPSGVSRRVSSPVGAGDGETDLRGKKVLIVDDDVRNLFALTGMLEHYAVHVLRAENGREALEVLQTTPDVDLVFMDIMMPEMDGYETIRAVRDQSRFRSLPIIALTAKAMKGDRRKCLEAGASDYLSKPVNREQLLSVLRVWLTRAEEFSPQRTEDRGQRTEINR